jgi:hypothetical protein
MATPADFSLSSVESARSVDLAPGWDGDSETPTVEPDESSGSTGLIVGVVGALVVVAGLAVFAAVKRKSVVDNARSNSGLRLDDGEMKENPLNAGAAGGSGGGEGANHTGEERANDLKMFNKQHGHGHGKAGVHAHGHHSHFGGGHTPNTESVSKSPTTIL